MATLDNVSPQARAAYNRLIARYPNLNLTSAYRDPTHNAAVGGARKSQHMSGNAFDFNVANMSIPERIELIRYAQGEPGFRGVGVYDNSIHLDVGPVRAWGPSYSSDSIPDWARPHLYLNRGAQPAPTRSAQSAPTFGQIRDAIATVESSNRYDIIGPPTRSGDRAYGKYQVMGKNVPVWTEQYLGRRMTPQEFLADPQAQEDVFNARFGEYYERFGTLEDAASMWFSGRPYAGNNRSDGYNTVQQYVDKVRSALGQPAQRSAQAGVQPTQEGVTPQADTTEDEREERFQVLLGDAIASQQGPSPAEVYASATGVDIPGQVAMDYLGRRLTPQQRADLEEDFEAGLVRLPDAILRMLERQRAAKLGRRKRRAR